jgi:antitoxin MazE
MQIQLSKWGNSLGIRIPKDVAMKLGLSENSRVDLSVEGDRIMISPGRPVYALEELLVGMTPEAMRDAYDWGPDAGRENIP